MNAKRLTTPKEKVQQLQEKLGHVAKENKKRKFHALYDKIYARDTLMEAWNRVRANNGAAGVDGETIATIEAIGVEAFLHDCQSNWNKGNTIPIP